MIAISPFPVTGAVVTESDGEVGKFAGGENQLPVTLAARVGPIAPGSGTTGWVTKFNTERFATVLVSLANSVKFGAESGCNNFTELCIARPRFAIQ